MIRQIDHTNQLIAEKILAIQKPAYLVEAKLINYFEIPPLHETIDQLVQCKEIFYGYFVENQLAGCVSISKVNQCIDICRLVVHPDYFRRGIGKALLTFIFDTYQEINEFSVMTGSKNEPAKKLYLSLEFKETSTIEIAPMIHLSQLVKRKK